MARQVELDCMQLLLGIIKHESSFSFLEVWKVAGVILLDDDGLTLGPHGAVDLVRDSHPQRAAPLGRGDDPGQLPHPVLAWWRRGKARNQVVLVAHMEDNQLIVRSAAAQSHHVGQVLTSHHVALLVAKLV